MQYKYIVSAFLRGLSYTDGVGRCVALYIIDQYRETPYAQKLTPHQISLPDGIMPDEEPRRDTDNTHLKELLRAVAGGYAAARSIQAADAKAQKADSAVALRVEDLVYLVFPISAVHYPHSQIVQDKIVLITGAAQGLGRGIADTLVKRGALVYIADIQLAHAKKTAEELRATHATDAVRALPLDCADEASVRACATTIATEVGGIDVLISNAGIVISGDIETLSATDFAKVAAVNYHGYFAAVKYFSPSMRYQHYANASYYGDIIQINSKSGLRGSLRNSAYAGSKFGGIGLTQSFALELAEHNIKVNSICPGNLYDSPLWSDPIKGLFVQYLSAGKVPHARTASEVRAAYEAQTPMRRGCTVDDVVKGILYLIDQTFETGQALPISGGQVMLH